MIIAPIFVQQGRKKRMRITIFGTGGIGGYLAGKLGSLLTAGKGLDSLFLVARGEHLAAIKQQGLRFIDVEGTEHRIQPTLATDTPGELPEADLILLCVKGYDLQDAAGAIKNKIAPGGAVLPLLNGADIRERVKTQLPNTVVYPGAIYISSTITEPGAVQHMGGKGLVVFGKDPAYPQNEALQTRELLENAGVPFEWHEDAYPKIWTKYLFIAPFALATAVHDKTIGEVLADAEAKADVRAMMEEVAAVARAQGISLPEDAVDKSLQQAENFPFDTRTSFQRDIAGRKPRDERDLFGGTMLRLGDQLKVSVPATRKYFNALP